MAENWLRSHAGEMNRIPEFEPKMARSGRWFVSVNTGNGPDSHVGDFENEEEAKSWIAIKSRYWPGRPPRGKQPI